MKFELTEEQIDTVITALHMQQTGIASNTAQDLTRQRQNRLAEDAMLTFAVIDIEGSREVVRAIDIVVEGSTLLIMADGDVVATWAPGQWRSAKLTEPLGQTGGETDGTAGGTGDGGSA